MQRRRRARSQAYLVERTPDTGHPTGRECCRWGSGKYFEDSLLQLPVLNGANCDLLICTALQSQKNAWWRCCRSLDHRFAAVSLCGYGDGSASSQFRIPTRNPSAGFIALQNQREAEAGTWARGRGIAYYGGPATWAWCKAGVCQNSRQNGCAGLHCQYTWYHIRHHHTISYYHHTSTTTITPIPIPSLHL